MAKKKSTSRGPGNEITEGLVALAYNRSGEFIGRGYPDGNELYFDLDADELRYARVFVFPEPPEGLEPITLERAESLVAYEPVVRLNENNGIDISRIPGPILERWLWYRCCTHGRVTKRFNIDGVVQEMPLCNALVHICEVDRFLKLLPVIPDNILDRLRDTLLERIPIPLPEPLPDPPFLDEIAVPIPPRPQPFRRFQASGLRNIGGQNLNLTQQTPTIDLPEQIRLELNNASANRMRQIIIDNRQLFLPYLCLWPMFWPWFYRCDEITTTRTDFNGRFEACFWRQIFEEKADLYFWVEYEINGVMTTVYKPPIPCYTYWDYDCCSEVNIRVTDPRVPMGCYQPLPGDIAWVKTIGWGAHVSRIEQQDAASITQQGNTLQTVGLTNYATGGLGHGLANKHVRPFAKSLHFVVQFGSGFPDSNVSHYRWSYRRLKTDKLTAASASDQAWVELDNRSVSKAYTIEETNMGITTFKTQHYPLGPDPIGGVKAYKIPPTSPKIPEVSGDSTAEWDQNTVTMTVDSTALKGDGLYEFKLEFFNSAGVQQNVPDTVFQISEATNLGNSTPAPAVFFANDPITGRRYFKMKVRVDNQKCTADIFNVKVDGAFSNTDCGFVSYNSRLNSEVEFSIRASHPNDFATFSFNVARGNSSDPLSDADTGGMVIGDTANGYILNNAANVYRKKVKVDTLLGTCPDKAAFAEYLYVDGLHTNGTSILNHFDASDLAAFALEPK